MDTGNKPAVAKSLRQQADDIRSWHYTYMEMAAYLLGNLDADDEELYDWYPHEDVWNVRHVAVLLKRIDELERANDLRGNT